MVLFICPCPIQAFINECPLVRRDFKKVGVNLVGKILVLAPQIVQKRVNAELPGKNVRVGIFLVMLTQMHDLDALLREHGFHNVLVRHEPGSFANATLIFGS